MQYNEWVNKQMVFCIIFLFVSYIFESTPLIYCIVCDYRVNKYNTVVLYCIRTCKVYHSIPSFSFIEKVI